MWLKSSRLNYAMANRRSGRHGKFCRFVEDGIAGWTRTVDPDPCGV